MISYLRLFLWFDLDLTLKSKMAAVGRLGKNTFCIFSIIWPMELCNICFWGFLGSVISYLRSFLWFDLDLTLKSKMATVSHLGKSTFCIFSTICPMELCNICFLGFWGSVISNLRSFLWFNLDFTLKSKMAIVSHLDKKYFRQLSTICPMELCNICFLGFLGSMISYLKSFLWFDLDLAFKSKMAAKLTCKFWVLIWYLYLDPNFVYFVLFFNVCEQQSAEIPELFKDIIPIIEAFHQQMSYLKAIYAIYKRFHHSGIADVLFSVSMNNSGRICWSSTGESEVFNSGERLL